MLSLYVEGKAWGEDDRAEHTGLLTLCDVVRTHQPHGYIDLRDPVLLSILCTVLLVLSNSARHPRRNSLSISFPGNAWDLRIERIGDISLALA